MRTLRLRELKEAWPRIQNPGLNQEWHVAGRAFLATWLGLPAALTVKLQAVGNLTGLPRGLVWKPAQWPGYGGYRHWGQSS